MSGPRSWGAIRQIKRPCVANSARRRWPPPARPSRLVLQPRLEIDVSASDSPELEIGSGLSSVEAGPRLRYEFCQELAPYVGGDPDPTRFVAGLKAWF